MKTSLPGKAIASGILVLLIAMGLQAPASGQKVPPLEKISPVQHACFGTETILLPDSVHVHGIASPRFEGPLCYLSWLPPGGVHPNEKLPVVVLLHGLHGAPSSWLRAKWVFDKAMADGAFPRALFLIPDGRDGYWTDWVDGAHPFGDVVLNEYLQDFQRIYPQAESHPEQTVIAGISMGGFGALSLGLLHPERFGYVVALSGTDLDLATHAQPRRKAYTDPFGSPIDRKAVKRVNPRHLVEANRGKGQHFWVIYGDREPRKFSEGGARLVRAMKKRGLKVTERVVAGGRHTWRNTWDDANLYWWIEEVGLALNEGKKAQGLRARATARRSARESAMVVIPNRCRLQLWNDGDGRSPGGFEVHCDLPDSLGGPCETLLAADDLKTLWPKAEIVHLSCGPQPDPRAMVLPPGHGPPIEFKVQLRREGWLLELFASCGDQPVDLGPVPCQWTGSLRPPPP